MRCGIATSFAHDQPFPLVSSTLVLQAAGHPSISLLAGLTKEAGLHASSISLLAGLKEEAGLRKKQLAEHREGLEKPWQSRSKSSTALVKLAAPSPPPATPPDSAALSADYKALYEQSEARRLAQIKLCDDVRATPQPSTRPCTPACQLDARVTRQPA